MSCRRTHEIRSHRSKARWVNKNKSICNDEKRKKYNFNRINKQLNIDNVRVGEGL